MRGENLPIIFGLKLRNLREAHGYGLKELAERVGMSPSYLNEIEKGKKYPKADKILHLAEALEVPYDQMVSLKLDPSLGPLESFLDSPIIQALPLQLFGLAPRDILDLIARAPHEVSALIQALVDIAHSYDMEVEHFFYAMLRSYQETRDNYFEEIEEAVAAYARAREWAPPLGTAPLERALAQEWGVAVDEQQLAGHPELAGFRSVWCQGPPERLLLNPRLSGAQKAFQMGREIGYRDLGLKARGIASSRAEVESFEQVLNDFKASYYAGALLIDREALLADLQAFFARETWDGAAFLAMMGRFQVTPEMFLYRLTQLIPRGFGLRHLHFIRLHQEAPDGPYRVNKQLNMGGPLLPLGIGPTEHYCRRWVAIEALRQLAAQQRDGGGQPPALAVQRACYGNREQEYLLISLARPLALTPGTNTSVTLGIRLDDAFRQAVRWWDDPAIPRAVVNETCERCPLGAAECDARVAPPRLHAQREAHEARRRALAELLDSTRREPAQRA